MEPESVKELIANGITYAKIEVIDTTATKDHFSAVVISSSFEGLSLIDQHKQVYKAVGEHMTKEIHALQLKTFSPEQWEKHNS